MNDIAKHFAQIVAPKQLLEPDAVAERATSFWCTAPMQASALVMPSSTDEVAAVLQQCHQRQQPVLTHGGLTNCVAAVESSRDDVILSTERLKSIVDIDRVGGTVTVEAGTILQNLQQAVAAEGLYFPLDLGARGSCTIGGNVATNAGGINVLRYGMMRNLVLGLETVLADGTVVSSLNRMLKNNAGYDTKQLFIGSEGTLGVVTRAVLRLYPQPVRRHNALVALDDFAAVTRFLMFLRQRLAGSLSAFEIMWHDYYHAVTAAGFHRAPLSRDHAFYVVYQAETSDPQFDDERFTAILEEAFAEQLVIDAVVPKSDSEVRDIWNIREDFEAITLVSPHYLYDVSLPIRDMQAYVDEVNRRVTSRWAEGTLYTLGHVADGNLHFFLCPGEPGDNHAAADACVYEPLQQYGGSVSAEHGIGTDKRNWLPSSRSTADLALMRTLKRSLDPKNILNPGRVLGPVGN